MFSEGNSGKAGSKLKGQVVYIYAYDLAYEMQTESIKTLLNQPIEEYSLLQNKRIPKYLFFNRPKTVKLPPESRECFGKTVSIDRSVKIFDVGAVSIQIRVPFEIDTLDELVNYHDLKFGNINNEQVARELAEQAKKELEPHLIKPLQQLSDDEPYTVFCLDKLPLDGVDKTMLAEDWLMTNRRKIAGILTQEENAANLSEQEAIESTGLYLSYYDKELVVTDWDATLVIGEKESLDDILHVMELANVQLAELEAYDRVLDTALETAYRDLGKFSRRNSEVRKNLREIKIDMARLSDELLNTTKFFGDWHLANIYENAANRFHLSDWHQTIGEKQKTLSELYEILQHDSNNFWMMVLEATIVLLFIIDLVLLFR